MYIFFVSVVLVQNMVFCNICSTLIHKVIIMVIINSV